MLGFSSFHLKFPNGVTFYSKSYSRSTNVFHLVEIQSRMELRDTFTIIQFMQYVEKITQTKNGHYGIRTFTHHITINCPIWTTGSKSCSLTRFISNTYTVFYYSTNCNTVQIWSWFSQYLSSVGNRYPAIYVILYAATN